MGSELRVLFLLSVFVMLSGLIYAVCEYPSTEQYTERGTALCLEGAKSFYAYGPEIYDFVNGTTPSFTVKNPNSYPIKLFFNYSIEGDMNREKFYGKIINGHDTTTIQDICFAGDKIGNCSIDPASISYFATDPRRMEQCLTNVPKTREVCNKSCQIDADCSPLVCNIAGFCGPKKVVQCPDGKTNCGNNSCLTPSIKSGGDSYSCLWECRSGTGVSGICKDKDGESCKTDVDCISGVCNVIHQCGETVVCPAGTKKCGDYGCFSASTKKYGEAYKCDWECKSGVGSNGVCERNLVENAFIIALLLLIVGAGGYLAFTVYRKFREKEADEMIRKAKQESARLLEEAKTTVGKMFLDLEDRRRKSEYNLHSIEQDIARKKQELDEATDEKGRLTITREDIQQIRRQISVLNARKKEDLRKQEELNKQIEDQQKENEKKWAELKPSPYSLVGNRLVIINPYLGGYLCFFNENTNLKNYSRSSLVHRWIWKEHHNGQWPRQGYHIHHKDENKYNNNINNLEEIEGTEHFELHRMKYEKE